MAFQKQFNAFLKPGRIRSLDEVFKSKALPTTSAKRAAGARNDWQTGGNLLARAWDIARDDTSLTSFNAVVDRLLALERCGMAKTKARSMLRQLEINQSQLLGHDTSLATFLTKRVRESRAGAVLAVASSGNSATSDDMDGGTP